MEKNFNEKIYDLVSKIPKGCVATYGQLAMLAGSPRASRIVGAAMYRAPQDRHLPCHRVIYSDGSLCSNDVFGHYEIQRQILESEGVCFLQNGKVDLKKHLWCG